MWQRFTERARRVVFFAQEEAGRSGNNVVDTEHLLLGLVRENDTVAARVLEKIGISLERIRSEIEARAEQGDGRLGTDMELSPQAKRVVDLAYDEAQKLNNNYIGTEHLLLGLVREADGMAGRVLSSLGVDLERARRETFSLQVAAQREQNEDKLKPISETAGFKQEGSTPMWQRFTERARRVIFFSQEEAGRLGENYVSTEHLLLGLLRESDCTAISILDTMGLPAARIRTEIERQVGLGEHRTGQDMQLTPRAKRVIDLAYDEARQLNNNYIGTQHILLGLIREGEGLAGRLLTNLGVDLEQARLEVLLLEPEKVSAEEENEPTGKAAFSNEALMGLLRGVARRLRKIDPALLPEAFMTGLTEQTDGEVGVTVGDFGTARSIVDRPTIEICLDAPAFIQLVTVYDAKDRHGYRAMASGDQTMFLVPVGTPLKLLATPPDGDAAAKSGGSYVRVLSGPYTGYAGWIFKAAFERTGPDAGEFPPRDEG